VHRGGTELCQGNWICFHAIKDLTREGSAAKWGLGFSVLRHHRPKQQESESQNWSGFMTKSCSNQSINQSINQSSKQGKARQASKTLTTKYIHKKLASKLLDLHFHEVFSRGSYEY
jgi:hypothetical protein